MSHLAQGSSSRNVVPDDDFDRHFDGAQQDGLTDSFGDDTDDDDLSLDGTYDNVGSTFNAQTAERFVPSFMSRSPLVTPNSALPYSSLVAPHSSLPRSPLVDPSSSLPRGPPVTPNAPLRTYYPGVDVCIVCQIKPPYSRDGKSRPTCSRTCARVLEYAVNGNKLPPGRAGYTTRPRPPPPPTHVHTNISAYDNTPQMNVDLPSFLAGLSLALSNPPAAGSRLSQPVATDPCVVCRKPLSPRSKYITCGLTCAEKITTGGRDANMCNYCHRRPKLAGHDQCGKTCGRAAKLACLLCKSRPKFKHYHLCGKTCKRLSTKKTPLLLEVPMGHVTWDMVQKKFDDAWKYGTKPTIKQIYKIIESKTFLMPYDKYKKNIGRKTEVFRYHGTSRRCKLGTNGNTMLCNDSGCSLCCILKTSFKTSLANPLGAFGAGIYSSSAANMAYGYSGSGQGGLILTKVVMGNVYDVSVLGGGVRSCPAGYHSVVCDQNGAGNQTIVYSDDAIRPVFLLVFT